MAHETLHMEIDTMVDEILDELRQTHGTAISQRISLPPIHSDMGDPAQQEQEKIARLKRMIAAGQYKVSPVAIARGILDKGDL